MMPADVKPNVKQLEIKEMVPVSYKFLSDVPNLKCNVKS